MADEIKCPHCGKPVPPTALGGICPECMLKAGFATQTEGPGANSPHGTKVVQPPPLPAEIASLFPQLEILECLGRGGMGVVYKARQPRLNRFVALKILAREKEQDAQFAERFTREAQALARLNHPNIVTVYDFGAVAQASSLSPSEKEPAKSETGATPVLHYLLMEFVDGLNLRQLLQAGKMPSAQALTIVPKICEALQYAHEQGIVHRDIKPENILLDKSGRVKIADFGIAKMMGDETGQQTLTGAKEAVGTPHYMAPEQIEKPLTVDHRADIYSLGVVFYEMLTGELPLGKFQPPSAKVQIDVRLDEVVLHALEKEPERRYQQASVLKTEVETIAQTSAPRGGGPESAPVESGKNQNGIAPAATKSPLHRGALTGFIVFLAITTLAIGVTLLLPRTYVGIALVRMAGPPAAQDPYHFQTESEVLQSQPVLEPVAASLNLGQRWGQKFNDGQVLSDEETVMLMKRRMEVQPVRGSSVIEIRFYSDSSKEAAEIANKIAETYCARPPEHTGEMIDRALTPWRPFRPNIPLNIFLGIIAGGIVGTLAGLAAGLFSNWRWRATRHGGKRPADEANPQNANPTGARSVGFGTAWRFAAFILVLILSYELSKTVFSHLIAGRSHPVKSDYIGQAWFPQGDFIEITSVERTPEQMVVTGHFNLVSHHQASLALYITSTNQPGFPEGAKQTMSISEGRGSFELVHPHIVPGLPHLSMFADGKPFAALYFGTQAEALEESKASSITNAPSAPDDTGTVIFGPEIERTLNDSREVATDCAIDLDSGQLFSLPPELVELQRTNLARAHTEIAAWAIRNGVDAIAQDMPDGRIALKCLDMVALGRDGNDWLQLRPDDFNREMSRERSAFLAATGQKTFGSVIPGFLVEKTSKEGWITFFQTREGSTGILQITGYTDSPPGVKIRYKLLQVVNSRVASLPVDLKTQP